MALFDSFETESFRRNPFYKRPDFLKLAELHELDMFRAERCLQRFADREDAVVRLIDRSFLSDEARTDYHRRYRDRLRAIAD